MNWLKKIFSNLIPQRCEHFWKCVHVVKHVVYDEEWDKQPSEEYLEKTWECQKCGKVRYTRIDL